MTDVVGYSTAFQNEEEGYRWESAEGVTDSQAQTLRNVRNVVADLGFTSEEEFSAYEPLYLTEVHRVRRITWEDVKPYA